MANNTNDPNSNAMSYQYPFIEHFSPSPTTSTPQSFAQWELPPEDQISPVSQQHQSSSEPSPPTYEVPQTIQLTERRPLQHRVHRDFRHHSSHSATPTPPGVRFEVDPASAGASPSPGPSRSEMGVTSDATGPVRQHSSNRSQVRFVNQPYPRKPNTRAAAASSERKKAQRAQEFDQIQPQASYTTIATPSTPQEQNVASGSRTSMSMSPAHPAMTISASSPASTPAAATSHEPPRQYTIRTDVHYAPETNLLTAMFEIPGVKKADLSVSLRVCPYSRVKRLRVAGKSQPAFADNGYSLRERKYGSFQRDIIVPQETTPANLSATLQDGVLILTMPGGTRVAGEEEVSEIPVN